MSIKKLLTASVLALGLATGAQADSNFTGFYAGGNLGYGHGNADFNNNKAGTSHEHGDMALAGFLYGLQAGYLYQMGMFVLGAELGWNFGNVDGKITQGDAKYKLERNHAFLLAARLGIVINTWMLYTSLGWQNTGFKAKHSGLTGDDNFSNSKRSNAFLLALGLETVIMQHLMLGLEWAYAFHQKQHFGGAADRFSYRPHTGDAKVRLSYKF